MFCRRRWGAGKLLISAVYYRLAINCLNKSQIDRASLKGFFYRSRRPFLSLTKCYNIGFPSSISILRLNMTFVGFLSEFIDPLRR